MKQVKAKVKQLIHIRLYDKTGDRGLVGWMARA